jgi:hypothetical protein
VSATCFAIGHAAHVRDAAAVQCQLCHILTEKRVVHLSHSCIVVRYWFTGWLLLLIGTVMYVGVLGLGVMVLWSSVYVWLGGCTAC